MNHAFGWDHLEGRFESESKGLSRSMEPCGGLSSTIVVNGKTIAA
jgi:hypothetical protein